MFSKRVSALVLAVLCLGRALPSAQGYAHGGSEPELVLQLDFVDVAGTQVHDAAGHGNDGTLERARVVADRQRTAVALDGAGQVTVSNAPSSLAAERRSFTIGARCKPVAPDGVIVSMGDATNGFSLYLRGGVPHFAVRAAGHLYTAVASEPLELNAWSHVAGTIGPTAELRLIVDTLPGGVARGSLLRTMPTEPLVIGADPGTAVGDYAGPVRWQGLVGDVRVYWGEVKRGNAAAILGDWADRPMCGTK